MPVAPVDLDLAAVAVKLRGPVSARERAQIRALILDRLRAPAAACEPITRDQAEKTFLATAAVLAGFGYTEMDLRDLLDREEACLDRAGRRAGRA